VALLYFVLSYAGINGFVTVFAVLGIAYELWHEMDVPMEYYTYGSAGIIPAGVLGGSLYTGNIMCMNGYGTSATAAMIPSIIMCAICLAVVYITIWLDVRTTVKKGEGFLPSGAAIAKNPPSTGKPLEKCAGAFASLICLIIPLACIVAGLNVLISLLVGVVCCIVVNFKHFDKKTIYPSIADGTLSGLNAIINCAGVLGVIYVYMAVSGYELLLSGVDLLPPVLGGVTLGVMSGVIAGSITNWMPAMIPTMMEKLVTQGGLSLGLAHRLTAITPFLYTTPHNTGCINGINLSKIDYGKGMKYYLKGNGISTFAALAISLILIYLGVFK
jgi:hypothetical protein